LAAIDGERCGNKIAEPELARGVNGKAALSSVTLKHNAVQKAGCMRVDAECCDLQGDLDGTVQHREEEIEGCKPRKGDSIPLVLNLIFRKIS
jgi:hypothetical protein